MKNKGFTIIELIITTVILGIVGVFTFGFIISGVESYLIMSDAEDTAREVRLALERMSREIRAAGIIPNADPNYDPIGTPSPGGSRSIITFDRTPPASSIDDSTLVTFQVTSGTLERQRGSNAPEPLASNVASFTVTRSPDPGELITLDLTLSVSGQSPVQQRTLVYPRFFK